MTLACHLISVCRFRQHLMVAAALALSLMSANAKADIIFVGTLSYNTFIPGTDGSPGVDAFNVSNLTGSFSLPTDFPVTDDLTFTSATLTLTFSDLSQEVLPLGDIAPGFLLDSFGNPVVQVSDTDSFISAELTATLSPLTFSLFDSASFTADSSVIDVLLLPSSGPTLTPDVDQTLITLNQQGSVPEPASIGLSASALLALIWGIKQKRPSNGSVRSEQ